MTTKEQGMCARFRRAYDDIYGSWNGSTNFPKSVSDAKLLEMWNSAKSDKLAKPLPLTRMDAMITLMEALHNELDPEP